MNIITRMTQSPLMAPAMELSRIAIYTAESFPIIAARKILGVAREPMPGPPSDHRRTARREVLELLKEDFANFQSGVYPESLLLNRQNGAAVEHVKRYLQLFKDSISAARRAKRGRFKEFSEEAKANLEGLPEYYARNFHFQTDGYLSEASADLYAHQTEILFMGTLAPMRRLLLADLIKIGLDRAEDFHVIEVGAGTGEASEVLLHALPRLKLEAVDLSRPYLAKARKRFQERTNASFIEADGTKYRSKTKVDAVISAYCLHEMPADVRKALIDNAHSNLRKGGHLLLIDSIQLGERPEFDWALKQFPKDFHEPFFANYIRTPLRDLLGDGFEVVSEKSRFLSKAILARKV